MTLLTRKFFFILSSWNCLFVSSLHVNRGKIAKKNGQWREISLVKQNDKFLQNANDDQFDAVHIRAGGRAFDVIENIDPEGRILEGISPYLDHPESLKYVGDWNGKISDSHQKSIINFENSPSASTYEVDILHTGPPRGPRHITKNSYANNLPGRLEPNPKLYYGFTPMIAEKDLPDLPGPTERPLENFQIPDIGHQLKSFYQPVWEEKQPISKQRVPIIAGNGNHFQSVTATNDFDRSKRAPSSNNRPVVVQSSPSIGNGPFPGPPRQPSLHRSPKPLVGEFNNFFRSTPAPIKKQKDAFRSAPHEQKIHNVPVPSNPHESQVDFNRPASGIEFQSQKVAQDPRLVQNFAVPQSVLSESVFFENDGHQATPASFSVPQFVELNEVEDVDFQRPERNVLKPLRDSDLVLPTTQYQQERSHLKSSQKLESQNFDPNHYSKLPEQHKQEQFFQSITADDYLSNNNFGENFSNHFSDSGLPASFEGNRFQSDLKNNNNIEHSPDVSYQPNQESFPNFEQSVSNSFLPAPGPDNNSPHRQRQNNDDYKEIHQQNPQQFSVNNLDIKKPIQSQVDEQKRPERSSLFRFSPNSVGYQQVNFNGINFKYEIPKIESNPNKYGSNLEYYSDEISAGSSKIEREVSPDLEPASAIQEQVAPSDPSSKPVERVQWPPNHGFINPGPFEITDNNLIDPPLDLPPVLQTEPLFDGPNKLEDPFWSLRSKDNPPLVEVADPITAVATPVPQQGIFREDPVPINPVQFLAQPFPNSQNEILGFGSDLKKGATPRPAFNPPYPDKIRQLPKPHHGSIPLKTHGPFKIQPLYGLSPTSPTTTLGPAFVSTLPPRIVVTPVPSQTVISTTFATNRFEPPLGLPTHQFLRNQASHFHDEGLVKNYRPLPEENDQPFQVHFGVVVTPTTTASPSRYNDYIAQDRLETHQDRTNTLAPFFDESKSQLSSPYLSDFPNRQPKSKSYVRVTNRISPEVETVTKAGYFYPQTRRMESETESGSKEEPNVFKLSEDDYFISQANSHDFKKI